MRPQYSLGLCNGNKSNSNEELSLCACTGMLAMRLSTSDMTEGSQSAGVATRCTVVGIEQVALHTSQVLPSV